MLRVKALVAALMLFDMTRVHNKLLAHRAFEMGLMTHAIMAVHANRGVGSDVPGHLLLVGPALVVEHLRERQDLHGPHVHRRKDLAC